jgi:septal ring factor EnvC (AmiA/AmiB activator)
MKSPKTKTYLLRICAGMIILAGALWLSGMPQQVLASRGTELQNRINQLEKRIAANREQAEEFEHRAETLEAEVARINRQIDQLNAQIELTTAKLDEINLKLAETRIELERQKGILREALRESYIAGDVRTLELLVNSEDFSDFFDQSEYLDRIRSTIQDSAAIVAKLEKQLEEQQAEQTRLLGEQRDQKNSREAVRRDKNQLLKKTRGQEARYRSIVSEIEKLKRQAEAELDNYILSLMASGVSLGPVSKGQVIGGVGNSGYSSGPHLHFAIHLGSSPQNPESVMRRFGWAWPVPARPNKTQGYHGGHPAIDIGTQGVYGVPIVATGDGELIHKGCITYSNPRFNNYGVIIKHAGGYTSRYIHMNPPAGAQYNACRANTY